ncbi:repressor LexA [Candidatus Uhrbacteria bacterium]|nr:repressor LexA [Candidatus Uhrbacteria bacterium]
MQKYLQKIKVFYHDRKRMPSYGEMAKLLGFKSKTAAVRLVDKMVEAGLIEKDSKGKLIPLDNLIQSLRVLGTVEAGFPSPAEEETADTMSLDEFLVEKKEATFMLKVKGDSMIEAGIFSGDMVLVERGRQACEGDIVIAEVDHAWTMKYLQKKNGKPVLVPGNKDYPIIVPQEELKIAAVVTAVIRKY